MAAIKYTLLKTNIGHDVTFNFEESISLSGNSGPYLQYAYVRTQSVLKKAGNINLTNAKISLNSEEISVLRLLSKFTEIALESSKRYSPNLLTSYLFELSQAFNLFYQKHSILEAKE
ncbi:DALR anticodon-binding domain-containing protein, partial [Candidatus Gracilibacteria bacterium]|nr:DALR anticodon-binding domain-containing protein [Candidatus Gracilibacteria bacterium]